MMAVSMTMSMTSTGPLPYAWAKYSVGLLYVWLTICDIADASLDIAMEAKTHASPVLPPHNTTAQHGSGIWDGTGLHEPLHGSDPYPSMPDIVLETQYDTSFLTAVGWTVGADADGGRALPSTLAYAPIPAYFSLYIYIYTRLVPSRLVSSRLV